MQRVLSAALSSSASLERAGAPKAAKAKRSVRFLSVDAENLNERLRSAWLDGWKRHHAPTNPCLKPQAQLHAAFQHGHAESSGFLGLRKMCRGLSH